MLAPYSNHRTYGERLEMNTTLQKVTEAIDENYTTSAYDGCIDNLTDVAQAAISAYKSSDEWKGVVEALGLALNTEGAHLDACYAALNKLNGGV